jgi:hypothetical protein
MAAGRGKKGKASKMDNILDDLSTCAVLAHAKTQRWPVASPRLRRRRERTLPPLLCASH